MKQVKQIFEEIESRKKEAEFLKTGFPTVDELLDGGFLRKELVVIGAFTGTGKSYVAGELFLNVAKQGFKSAYFSLEISNETIVSRLAGSIANIKPTRLSVGLLTPEEYENYLQAKAELTTYKELMYFYDDIYSLAEMETSIKEGQYEFVVIDFIQNIFHGGQEYERLSEVSLRLQKLAKETNSCILTLSQLSNSAAKDGSMEYKGSGAIATVCDLGFFMKRADSENGVNDILLSLRKNRRGFSGKDFVLKFQQPGGKIYEP